MSDSKATRQKRIPSQKKSEIASKKIRVNGKFVSADPEAAARKKEELERIRIATEGPTSTDVIPAEAREEFGTDSKKFFEVALKYAPTWYEALKYAKELKPLQHAALSSIEVNQQVEVTHKVLRWQWGEETSLIEAEASLPIEAESVNLIESQSDDNDPSTATDT
jgi:hypothetical protein